LRTEEDALIAVDWPSRRLHALRAFPARRLIDNADYSADGKRVLSFADHILVMMDADGENLVGLSGTPQPPKVQFALKDVDR
jgi:hypothetical protein